MLTFFPPYRWNDLSIYYVTHKLEDSGNLQFGGQWDFPGGPGVRAAPSSVGVWVRSLLSEQSLSCPSSALNLFIEFYLLSISTSPVSVEAL